MLPLLGLLALAAMILGLHPETPCVVINEVCSNNFAAGCDENGEYSDSRYADAYCVASIHSKTVFDAEGPGSSRHLGCNDETKYRADLLPVIGRSTAALIASISFFVFALIPPAPPTFAASAILPIMYDDGSVMT